MQPPFTARIDQAVGDQCLKHMQPTRTLTADAQALFPEIIQPELIPQFTGQPARAPLARSFQLQLTELDLDNIAIQLGCLAVFREDGNLLWPALAILSHLDGLAPGGVLLIIDLAELPGDKVNALVNQVDTPRIVGIATVEDDEATLGLGQGAGQVQTDKLRPAGHHLAQASALMVISSLGFEFMSRNQFEYLREHSTMMSQCLNLLTITVFASTTIVTAWIVQTFFISRLWDSSDNSLKSHHTNIRLIIWLHQITLKKLSSSYLLLR